MNKEEILNKYIDLIDKGYCSDCNELNCIDNFTHAKITHAIRELQQENQKYKEVIDKIKEWINIVQQNKDNKHLEPIICTDELDELLDILKEADKEV